MSDTAWMKPSRVFLAEPALSFPKTINRMVRGHVQAVAVQRTAKPSKRKAAIAKITKLSLAATKARRGTIDSIHADNSIF